MGGERFTMSPASPPPLPGALRHSAQDRRPAQNDSQLSLSPLDAWGWLALEVNAGEVFDALRIAGR